MSIPNLGGSREWPIQVSSSSEGETSSDTEGDKVNGNLAALLEDLSIARPIPEATEPFALPRLVPQQSFFIPEDALNDLTKLIQDDAIVTRPLSYEESAAAQHQEAAKVAKERSLPPQKISKNIDPLKDLAAKVTNKKLNKTIKSTSDLSINGQNILHYLAKVPHQFENYKNLFSNKKIKTLIHQFLKEAVPSTKETVLHVICRHQNGPMLDWLMQDSANKEHLYETGKQLTEPTKCNAFLAFGHSLLDDKVEKVYAARMLSLLTDIYGEREAIFLIQTGKDSQEHTLFNLAVLSKHEPTIQAVSELMTKKV